MPWIGDTCSSPARRIPRNRCLAAAQIHGETPASRLSPYSRFIGRCRLLQFSDRFYYAKLTMYFKEYIESVYNIGIKGKTSGEIMDSINRLPGLQQVLPGIENWLRESDYYKFSGVAASNEKKRILIDELVEVVNRIERENKDND